MIKKSFGFSDPSFLCFCFQSSKKKRSPKSSITPNHDKVIAKITKNQLFINKCKSFSFPAPFFWGFFFLQSPKPKRRSGLGDSSKVGGQPLIRGPTFCRNLPAWTVTSSPLLVVLHRGWHTTHLDKGHCNQPTFPGSLLTTTRSISFQCQESVWLFTLQKKAWVSHFFWVFQGIWPENLLIFGASH